MIRLLLWLLIVLAVGLLAGLLITRCSHQREYKRTGRHHYKSAAHEPVTFDTVRLARIEPLQAKSPVAVPVRTIEATIPDTALRRQAEKRTIITGVVKRERRHRKEADLLYIQTIDPKGIVRENVYPGEWVQMGKWEIDSVGRLHIDPIAFADAQQRAKRKEKWKKIWRTAKTVVVSGIVGYASFQVGKAL